MYDTLHHMIIWSLGPWVDGGARLAVGTCLLVTHPTSAFVFPLSLLSVLHCLECPLRHDYSTVIHFQVSLLQWRQRLHCAVRKADKSLRQASMGRLWARGPSVFSNRE